MDNERTGKKVLILTAATGGGHMRAAQAMAEYLEQNTDYQVKSIDGLKATAGWLDKIVCGSYLFMARRAPSLFGVLYRWTDKDTWGSRLLSRLNIIFGKMILPEIKKEKPDVIITVHPFITDMISSLKDAEYINVPLICTMTDYGPHQAWLADHTDAFITATPDMTAELTKRGIPEEKIFPYGIPVCQQFFESYDKTEFLESIELSANRSTVLLMAGSFGVNSVINLYRDLDKASAEEIADMQLIVITGKNEKLHRAFAQEIETNKSLPTKLVFFTSEVEKYMHSSDLLITKPGGLTVSEAIACNLPLAVFDAIPGQEEDNADFLERHGMGIKLKKGDDIAERVSTLIADGSKLEDMSKACNIIDSKDSMPQLISLMEHFIEKYEVQNAIISEVETSIEA